MAYHSASNRKPRASSWKWTTCQFCDNLHLVLEDENGMPFADMTLSPNQTIHFINQMEEQVKILRNMG